MVYEVGKVINAFKGREEGVVFDMDNTGAVMLVFFKAPSKEEIAQFASGVQFEIRVTDLYDVIVMTTKIGTLHWMDAPYTPHLSNNLGTLQYATQGQGLALTLVLVDTVTGKIKALRVIGLSTQFTNKFVELVEQKLRKPFDDRIYHNNVNMIIAKYSTDTIAQFSIARCKIR